MRLSRAASTEGRVVEVHNTRHDGVGHVLMELCARRRHQEVTETQHEQCDVPTREMTT